MHLTELRHALAAAESTDLAHLLDGQLNSWNLEAWPGLALWEHNIALLRVVDDDDPEAEMLLPLHRVKDIGQATGYSDLVEVRDATLIEILRTNEWAKNYSSLESLATVLEAALGGHYSLTFTASGQLDSGLATLPDSTLGLLVYARASEKALASIFTHDDRGWAIAGGRVPLVTPAE